MGEASYLSALEFPLNDGRQTSLPPPYGECRTHAMFHQTLPGEGETENAIQSRETRRQTPVHPSKPRRGAACSEALPGAPRQTRSRGALTLVSAAHTLSSWVALPSRHHGSLTSACAAPAESPGQRGPRPGPLRVALPLVLSGPQRCPRTRTEHRPQHRPAGGTGVSEGPSVPGDGLWSTCPQTSLCVTVV